MPRSFKNKTINKIVTGKPIIRKETIERDEITTTNKHFDKFVKEINKQIIHKKNYTLDNFLNDLNAFKNVYNLEDNIDFDDKKEIYFELLLNLFKEQEIKKIVDNDEEYTFKQFNDDVNEFFRKNGVNISYFNKNSRDVNKIYDEILEQVGKLTVYKTKDKEKSKSIIKGLYTKFIQRYIILETDFLIYKQKDPSERTVKEFNSLKNKLYEFRKHKSNIFDFDELKEINKVDGYKIILDALDDYQKELNTSLIPQQRDEKPKRQTKREKKVIEEVINEVIPEVKEEELIKQVVDEVVESSISKQIKAQLDSEKAIIETIEGIDEQIKRLKSIGRKAEANQLEIEIDEYKKTLAQIRTNIQLLQRDERAEKRGKGIFDKVKSAYKRVKNVFTNEFSPVVEKAEKKYGNYEITKGIIYRAPIQKVLSKILNILSKGQFNKNLEEYHYDDAYHLWILLECINPEDGSIHYFSSEKKPHITFDVKDNSGTSEKDAMMLEFNVNPPVKISDMFNESKKELGKNFANYTADEYNCQSWVLSLVNGIYKLNNSNTPSNLKDFIYQDPEHLFKDLGKVRHVANAVTKLGLFTERIKGNGKKKIVHFN